MTKQLCNSCKADISIIKNSTKFLCPKCGKGTIVRCGGCRLISTEYKCEECGFVGP